MGNISDSVVRHTRCPVMVVRSQKERASKHEADFVTYKGLYRAPAH